MPGQGADMDMKEVKGRILAIEALVAELILEMEPAAARKLVGATLPGLQRLDGSTTTHATTLPHAINQRIKAG